MSADAQDLTVEAARPGSALGGGILGSRPSSLRTKTGRLVLEPSRWPPVWRMSPPRASSDPSIWSTILHRRSVTRAAASSDDGVRAAAAQPGIAQQAPASEAAGVQVLSLSLSESPASLRTSRLLGPCRLWRSQSANDTMDITSNIRAIVLTMP